MKTVCELNQCAGCKLCVAVCNKNAIKIDEKISAYNAIIDKNLCVKCGKCEKSCPVNNHVKKEKPIYWWQGWANNCDVRKNASSGGIASALQISFIENGGIVCSCIFDKGNFVFDFAFNPEEVKKFTGSKYVKSDPNGIYTRIKTFLNANKKVLFVGLPCQCAALKQFTNNHILLYTVDLICHGTPAPQNLQMFLCEKGYKIETFENMKFREKTSFYLSNENETIEPNSVRDRYTMAFLKSLSYTENCYSCIYADILRVSDITLGDSWGSTLNTSEQKKGVSLILCQTDKGKELLDSSDIHLENVELDRAILHNRQLQSPSQKPLEYQQFHKALQRKKGFNSAVKKCYPKDCFRQSIKAMLCKLKLINNK